MSPLSTRRRLIEPSKKLLNDPYAVLDLRTQSFDAANDRLVAKRNNGLHGYLGSATPAVVENGGCFLPGLSGNYIQTPDSTGLAIAGDLDIRIKVALTNWIPATDMTLVSQWDTTTAIRSYAFMIQASTGKLKFNASTDGTNVDVQVTSTVAPTVIDGATLWVRVTRGSASGTITCYSSTDGTNWTDLGTTVAAAPSGALFNSTTPLMLGARNLGTLDLLIGTIYQAEVRSVIAGTTVASPNFTGLADNTLSFNDTQGNPWRVMRGAVINGGALELSGATSNNASTPDSAALSITGDIDIRANIVADTLTPVAVQELVGKWNGGTNALSYLFRLQINGTLELRASSDGTTSTTVFEQSTTGLASRSGWVRVTLDVDNGSSQHVTKFYTSADGIAWTQLGTTLTSSGAVAIFDSAAAVTIGTANAGAAGTGAGANGFTGRILRAQIYNGIAGTLVADARFDQQSNGTKSFFDTPGNLWTITTTPTNIDTKDPVMLAFSGTPYMYVPGLAGNYASTPDSAAVSVTSDLDVRADILPDNWVPTASGTVVGKFINSGAQNSWRLSLLSNGTLQFAYSADGSTLVFTASSVVTGFKGSQRGWIRATYLVTNGSNREVRYYTSSDGVTWTQLGTTRTGTIANIFDSTSVLAVGGNSDGTEPFAGKVYRAKVFNGINGTLVADFDPARSVEPHQTLVASTGETWTLVRAASQKKLALVDRSMSLMGLSANTYFQVFDNDLLDFNANEYFTLLMTVRRYGTNSAGAHAFASKSNANGGPDEGYVLNMADGARLVGGGVGSTSSTVKTVSGATTVTEGATHVIGLRVRAGSLDALLDGIVDATNTFNNHDIRNTLPFRVGVYATGSGFFASDFEFLSATLFRRALTDSELKKVSTELLTEATARSIGTDEVFSPPLYSNLIVWGAADRVTANDGDAVSSLTNRIDGTTLTQATASKRPLFKATAINGRPSLQFDGVDDYLQMTFDSVLPPPNTVFVVVKYITATTPAIFFDGAGAAREAIYVQTPSGAVPRFSIYASGAEVMTTTLADTDPHVMTATFNGVDSSLRIDGALAASGNPGTEGLGGVTLGIGLDGSSFPANVNIAEVLVYNAALTTTQCAQVEAYLGNKYAISTALLKSTSCVAAWSARTYDAATDSLTDLRGNGLNARFGSATGADASDPVRLVYAGEKYAYLPGIAGNYISTPDSATASVTGDIAIRADVALASWVTGADQALIGKWASGTESYLFAVEATGKLRLYWVEGGVTLWTATSTIATGFSASSRHKIGVALDVDNGASGSTTTFYTSIDGITWNPLGTAITQAGVTTINDTASIVEVGSTAAGTANLTVGTVYNAEIAGGTVSSAATVRFNASGCTEPYETTVAATGETWTFNRTASGKKLTVVDRTMLQMSSGTYLEVADNNLLDFSATESFTIAVAYRHYGVTTSNERLMSKALGSSPLAGYTVHLATGTRTPTFTIADGTLSTQVTSGNYSDGLTTVFVGRRDVVADQIRAFTGITGGTATTDTTTASLATSGVLRFGYAQHGAGALDGEFLAAAVLRRALSDAEVERLIPELLAL